MELLPQATDAWDSYCLARLFNEARASSNAQVGLKDPPPVTKECPRVELVALRLRVLAGAYRDDLDANAEALDRTGSRDKTEAVGRGGCDLDEGDFSHNEADPTDFGG